MNDNTPTRSGFDSIRQQILDRIDSGEPIRRPRAARLKLASQRSPEWDMEWLETTILLNCYMRSRPARTHGNLGRLRKLRAARGQMDTFDGFMAKVVDILHPEFITPHGYSTTFDKLDASGIFSAMGEAFGPVAALGHPVFLYAGALLGYVRNGKLIDHDDDIDLAVYLGDLTHDQVADRWLEYKVKLAKCGLLSGQNATSRAAIFKLNTTLPIDVDLFPAWTTNGKLSVYPYSFDQVSTEQIFTLTSHGLAPVLLPKEPEALLKVSYGEDWRVPDPLFHVNWPNKQRIFHQLCSKNYALGDT